VKSSNPLFGKEKIKILLIRPPGFLWPIVNESDNFLLPLGLPSIAAYLREHLPGAKIEIIDCCPMRYGWKTLTKILAEKKPDVVGVGDMICYVKEGMRTLKIAKELNPGTVTIAGGHFHSFMTEYSLKNHPWLDYIVRWEGEEATRQLIEALRGGTDLSQVGNLAYRDGDRLVHTKPLTPIQPLDSLPMPAYDLAPIEKYAPFGKLWPKAITIQGNRGCPHHCKFCSWAALEGDHLLRKNGQEFVRPSFRTKSVGRIIEEIDLLYHKYDIRYLFWVEGTWNFDNEIMDELSDEILKRGYKLGWWAFVRPDKLLEQEELGILEKMVRAGFSHTLLGGERNEEDDFDLIGKAETSYAAETKFETLKRCTRLLEEKYPTVFRQATFITGIPSDSKESLLKLGKDVRTLHLDFAAFHPLMPYPGTDMWEQYKNSPILESTDFSKFDMFQPVMRTHHMTRDEVAKCTEINSFHFVLKQPHRYLMGMFSRIQIRRRLHWWFLFSTGRVIFLDFWRAIRGKKSFSGFAATSQLWKPPWYDN